MSRERNKKYSQRGEVVVESTIVMVVTIMLVFIIMNMVIAVYNQQLVTTTATRAATDVAAVYGRASKDPFYGFMDDDDFENNSPYRYFDIMDLDKKNEKKAKWYASYYLDKEILGDRPTNIYNGITVEASHNAMLQRTLTVKVVEEFPVFSLNPTAFFGLNPKYTVSAQATAVCLDPINDMNLSKMYDEFYDIFMKSNKVTKIADAVLKLILKINGYV